MKEEDRIKNLLVDIRAPFYGVGNLKYTLSPFSLRNNNTFSLEVDSCDQALKMVQSITRERDQSPTIHFSKIYQQLQSQKVNDFFLIVSSGNIDDQINNLNIEIRKKLSVQASCNNNGYNYEISIDTKGLELRKDGQTIWQCSDYTVGEADTNTFFYQPIRPTPGLYLHVHGDHIIVKCESNTLRFNTTDIGTLYS